MKTLNETLKSERICSSQLYTKVSLTIILYVYVQNKTKTKKTNVFRKISIFILIFEIFKQNKIQDDLTTNSKFRTQRIFQFCSKCYCNNKKSFEISFISKMKLQKKTLALLHPHTHIPRTAYTNEQTKKINCTVKCRCQLCTLYLQTKPLVNEQTQFHTKRYTHTHPNLHLQTHVTAPTHVSAYIQLKQK